MIIFLFLETLAPLEAVFVRVGLLDTLLNFFRFGFRNWTSGLRYGARKGRMMWCYIVHSLNVISDHRVKKYRCGQDMHEYMSYGTEDGCPFGREYLLRSRHEKQLSSSLRLMSDSL